MAFNFSSFADYLNSVQAEISQIFGSAEASTIMRNGGWVNNVFSLAYDNAISPKALVNAIAGDIADEQKDSRRYGYANCSEYWQDYHRFDADAKARCLAWLTRAEG